MFVSHPLPPSLPPSLPLFPSPPARLSIGNNTCNIANDPSFSSPVLLDKEARRALLEEKKKQGAETSAMV